MRLIKEYSWCKKYNIDSVTVDINPEQEFVIWNSYKIKKSRHMMDVLKTVNAYFKTKHSLLYLLCEWKIHNLLNTLKYKRVSEHCVFSENITLGKQILYFIMSLFDFK